MAEVIGRSGLVDSGLQQTDRRRCHFRAGTVAGVRFQQARRFPVVKLNGSAFRSSVGAAFVGTLIGADAGCASKFEASVSEKRRGTFPAVSAQMSSGIIGRSHKWWEKGIQPNMKEVTSAQDLVDSLAKAGNKLVVLEFFSPGCGGCKALHPKICQLAEQNPDVRFLQINHEEHKSLAYSLGVHVLPFFRFYRGAQGRLCSFSCTNATIKKFKDALAKHNTDRCSLGPAKGLEEKELLALAANKDLGFSYTQPVTTPMKLDILPIRAVSQLSQDTVTPSESTDSSSPHLFPLPLNYEKLSSQKARKLDEKLTGKSI